MTESTVDQIRRANLCALVEVCREKGNTTKSLYETLGTNASAHAALTGSSSHVKNIGGRLARQWETRLHVEEGWFDKPHSKEEVRALI